MKFEHERQIGKPKQHNIPPEQIKTQERKRVDFSFLDDFPFLVYRQYRWILVVNRWLTSKIEALKKRNTAAPSTE